MVGLKYKHVFFDLDRTLWDLDTNSAQALKSILAKFDKLSSSISSSQQFIKIFNEFNDLYWDLYSQNKVTKEQLRVQRFYKTLCEFGIKDYTLSHTLSREYTNIAPKNTHLISGTIDVLTYLQEKYSLHILTNGFDDIQDIKIKHSGIASFFKNIITSDKAKSKKPSKLFYDYAVQKADAIHSQCIMIGDNIELDVIGAKNAGVEAIYFNPEGKLHGKKIKHEITDLLELKNIL